MGSICQIREAQQNSDASSLSNTETAINEWLPTQETPIQRLTTKNNHLPDLRAPTPNPTRTHVQSRHSLHHLRAMRVIPSSLPLHLLRSYAHQPPLLEKVIDTTSQPLPTRHERFSGRLILTSKLMQLQPYRGVKTRRAADSHSSTQQGTANLFVWHG